MLNYKNEADASFFKNMLFNNEINHVLKTLMDNGYEAYLVGGYVRDYLMGIESFDADITTNASANSIKLLFNEYPLYEIGKELGTVTLVFKNLKIDITPYRKEGEYLNHRRPKEVKYTDSLKEDLSRRDFTINAICLNNDEIIDIYNGQEDIKNKIIKTIGDPSTRFKEDALRILRALRFKAKLGFVIEDKTNDALFKEKDLLKEISNERKKTELINILSGNNIDLLINDYLDIFNTFIPINKTDKRINNFNNPYFKLAYLLNDELLSSLKELSFSKHEINLLKVLYKIKDININDDYSFINCLSDDIYMPDILLYLEELYNVDLNHRFNKLRPYMVTINSLKIKGDTLKEYGYKDKEIKKKKEELVELIKRQSLINDEKEIINYLK